VPVLALILALLASRTTNLIPDGLPGTLGKVAFGQIVIFR
jgi:hypothetical protein